MSSNSSSSQNTSSSSSSSFFDMQQSTTSPIEERKHKSLVVLDFDGTLTNVPGSDLVFTPFYRQFLDPTKMNKQNPQDYLTPMIPVYSILKKLRESPVEALSYKISPKAEEFLERLLIHADMKDSRIRILIISKNQTDYIQSMLLACKSQLIRTHTGHISIMDINSSCLFPDGPFKSQALTHFLMNCAYTEKVQFDSIRIFEDDAKEVVVLKESLKGSSIPYIYTHCEPPGNFNWSHMTDLVMKDIELSTFRDFIEIQKARTTDILSLFHRLCTFQTTILNELLEYQPSATPVFDKAESDASSLAQLLEKTAEEIMDVCVQICHIKKFMHSTHPLLEMNSEPVSQSSSLELGRNTTANLIESGSDEVEDETKNTHIQHTNKKNKRNPSSNL